MKTLFRLLVIVLVLVLAAFVAFDNPRKVVAQTAGQTVCPLGMDKLIEGYSNFCVEAYRELSAPLSLPIEGLNVTIHPTERDNGLRVGRVGQNFVYCHDATGNVFTVSEGFYTNFASIPWWARWYANPMGDHMEAAVVHDWVYSVGGKPTEERRLMADNIFRDILAESGVNIVKRNILYSAVRTGGSSYYNINNPVKMRQPDWSQYTIQQPQTAITQSGVDCKTFSAPGPIAIE